MRNRMRHFMSRTVRLAPGILSCIALLTSTACAPVDERDDPVTDSGSDDVEQSGPGDLGEDCSSDNECHDGLICDVDGICSDCGGAAPSITQLESTEPEGTAYLCWSGSGSTCFLAFWDASGNQINSFEVMNTDCQLIIVEDDLRIRLTCSRQRCAVYEEIEVSYP